MPRVQKLFQLLAIIGVMVFLSLYFLRPIQWVTADLGRHLQNGAHFFDALKPINTNFYSYTYPDEITLNHHWGSGALFFWVGKLWGFVGLSVFYVILRVGAVYFMWESSRRLFGFERACLAFILALPLICLRGEIRPEGISYFFLGLQFFLTALYFQKKITTPVFCAWIFCVQLFWVNAHIYFFIGAVAAFIYWAALRSSPWIPFSALAGSLINPAGLRGALAPLTIFRQYGYELAENQSLVFWLRRLWPDGSAMIHYIYAAVFFTILIIAIAFRVRKRADRSLWFWAGALCLGIMAMKTTRAIPLLGLAAIPCVASLLGSKIKWVGRALAVVTLTTLLLFPRSVIHPLSAGFGLGLMPGSENSAQFFIKNGLRGPIFNNYDIGGYLIYYLFPRERVFVDNRPEAYPVSFFKNEYIAAQEDESAWKKISDRYGFNAIYFWRHDLTPWGQPFLIQRVSDPEWAPVYVDAYSIIFLKRSEANAALIQKFEIPKDLFRVKKN